MGIMDKVGALVPWRAEHRDRPADEDALTLRDDLDRWLQRLFDDPWGSATDVEVRETDDELVVTAEVPGLDREDLELTITPGALIIRGEKREEKQDQGKDFYMTEARYGRFVRTVPLPTGLDVDRASARVRHGVLTVKFPKAAAGPGARRIAIKT